jgi:hypothetical protein
MGRGEHFAGLAARAVLLGIAGLAAAVPAGWAQPTPSPLQRQAAEAAVRDLRLESESSEVGRHLQVLAPYTSLPAGAAIHVVSARQGFTPGTYLLRFDCASRRDCLPFHAVLRMQGAEAVLLRAGGQRAPKPPTVERGRPIPSAALAHRGDEVELIEEFPGMRLRASVVCLDSGALGDRIRVENRSTHRIVVARVAGPEVVKVEQ